MGHSINSSALLASCVCIGTLGFVGAAASADLGEKGEEVVAAPSAWTFQFTPYGWLPWISGDLTVKGRGAQIEVSPLQIVEALDWSGVPAWMSYMEARRGPLSLFNDIVYVKLSDSADFARSTRGGALSFGADIKAGYEQAVIEAGGAYEIWSSGYQSAPGVTAFDLVAGARYWRQEVEVSADLATTIPGPGIIISGDRAISASGVIDWVDPFVGARVRHQLAAGQEVVLRGDIGGFGVGSDFSWQVIGAYNWQICVTDRVTFDGFVGYRALSVDYEQGSGATKYEFDAITHGPTLGATMRF